MHLSWQVWWSIWQVREGLEGRIMLQNPMGQWGIVPSKTSGYFGGCKHNFWFISPNWMMILMFIIVHLESGGGKHAYTFRGKLPDVAILVPQTGMLLAYICTYLCS